MPPNPTATTAATRITEAGRICSIVPVMPAGGPATTEVPSVSPPGPSPATIGPHEASPQAGQVVRRILRRNIVIDSETAR